MSKIAIIGSGISGISAAYELKKRGHQDVVVFEKEPRIGGKCATIDIEGKNYEMGAMVVGKSYKSILEMASETGCTLRPMEKVELADTIRGKYYSLLEKLKMYTNEILPLSWTVVPEFRKYPFPETGYQNINREELGQNFESWLAKKKFSRFKDILASFYTTWGYGYFEDTPAIYVRKLLYPERLMRVFVQKPFKKTTLYHLNEGYQSLVEKVVDACNIQTQTGSNIQSVKRADGKIHIRTERGQFEFDKLIVACPLDKALQFMDATGQEKELLSKARVRDFHTFTCEVEKLPNIEISFSKTDLSIDRGGYPIGWYKRYPDSNVYTFYVDNPNGYSPQQLFKNMKETVDRFGGKIKKEFRHDTWEYFPHVSAEEIKNGFYEKMEQLQGQKNTLYVGEILAFPTVEDCSNYSRELVKKHFEIQKEHKFNAPESHLRGGLKMNSVIHEKPARKLGASALRQEDTQHKRKSLLLEKKKQGGREYHIG
jgi:hypothetical protein